MAKTTSTLDWCIVRLGDDLNWWVEEVSDSIRWDTDGLSIIDPRQLDHILELIEPLRDYGFDPDHMERAFLPFRIDRDLGKNRVRLTRMKESILEAEEKLFALPDTIDDENSPYADFLDHITRLRVKMLNDLFDFDQKLTVDEVEDEIREENNADFMEGKAIHLYQEIVAVLDYVPAGWEIDEDDESPRAKKREIEEEENFPEIEEDEEELKGDESLRWDEDEDEEKEEEVDEYGRPKKKEGQEGEEAEPADSEGEEKPKAEEEEKPARKRRGRT
jgi:hypothetical protein